MPTKVGSTASRTGPVVPPVPQPAPPTTDIRSRCQDPPSVTSKLACT
jgi:hypothetical protein